MKSMEKITAKKNSNVETNSSINVRVLNISLYFIYYIYLYIIDLNRFDYHFRTSFLTTVPLSHH